MIAASFDSIDAAFLQRMEQAAPPEPIAAAPAAADPDGSADEASVPLACAEPDSPLGRLLRLVPDQWSAVADRIEAAAAAGQRVIAIVGGRRGEGRTTLVQGAAATLTARRQPVRCVVPGDLGGLEWRGREMITLVDAGIWFPPGPVRMERIVGLAQGCDAVILVRHAADPPSPARGEVFARLGVACLGEVETFATP